jgi:adenosylhomocysteine nucleosidase
MFAFLVAMDKEAKPILANSTVAKTFTKGYAVFYEASYKKKPFVLVRCGIGKAFSSSATSALIISYPSLEGIINVGVSGSLNASKTPLFTPLVATSFVEHDLDTSAIGDPVGLVSGINQIRFYSDKSLVSSLNKATIDSSFKPMNGAISSGDKFETNSDIRQGIEKRFSSLAVDMESGGFAQIAYSYKVPFGALRTISDADSPSEEYAVNCQKAIEIAGKIILKFIEEN